MFVFYVVVNLFIMWLLVDEWWDMIYIWLKLLNVVGVIDGILVEIYCFRMEL